MSAPPLLRPLRAMLQRRLHIVSSRSIRTPHIARAPSHHRHQLRYNSSIPPDGPAKPEDPAQDASTEQPSESETTPNETAAEDTQHAADSSAQAPEATYDEAPVTTFNISGHGGDALRETAIPRLDSQLVKAAFQQLKNTDEEIQASISEVAARQLEAEGPESAVQEVGEGVQDQADGLSAQETGEVAETAASEPLDAGLETAAPEDIIQETVLQESASEEVVQEAVPEPSSQEPIQEEVVQKPVQEPVKQETAQQAASPKTPAPAAAPAPPTAPPGLEALMSATPEQLAAMMAYLQTLQAAKAPAAPVEAAKPEPTIPEAPKEPQQVSEIVASESSIPASPSADAVAAMSQPLEPTEQVSAAAHAAESPALESTPAEDVLSRSFEDEEDDFFVEPIDKDPGPLVEKAEQSLKTEPQLELEQQPEQQPELHTRPEPEPEPENAPLLEPLESAVRDSAVDVMEPAKQIDSLESVVEEEEERAPSGQETETSSVDDSVEAAMNDSVEAAINDELAKVDLEAHAKELDLNEEVAKMDMELIDELKGEPDEQLTGELNAVILGDNPEPSRLPRNVSSYYLQPLRRVAEYGVPSCDLQLRSYSVRPLESFCDFALRAAYYLGLPAYGPVPLPKIIQRWTVPRSHFIFKKSQENFERITRRRLIQIKDGNPETVQIWLAFLQKHQQAAVGLKANLWEFSSIDVAKQLDEAYKEAEPMIQEKLRLLVQKKDFETVEKVDEVLQSERYRLTGDRVERYQ